MSEKEKPLTDEELADIQTKAGLFGDGTAGEIVTLFARTCLDLVAEVRRLRGPHGGNLSTALAFERAAERQAEDAMVEIRRLRELDALRLRKLEAIKSWAERNEPHAKRGEVRGLLVVRDIAEDAINGYDPPPLGGH